MPSPNGTLQFGGNAYTFTSERLGGEFGSENRVRIYNSDDRLVHEATEHASTFDIIVRWMEDCQSEAEFGRTMSDYYTKYARRVARAD